MSSLNFVKHRPIDKSDPGFTIPGKKLRWVSSRVSENNPGRPWRVLRKGDLTPEMVKHLEGINPEAFAHGETIRRGDLVLSYSSDEAAKEFRKELNEKARFQEKSVARAPRVANPDGSPRASVEFNEDRDVTREMVNRFKSSKQDN